MLQNCREQFRTAAGCLQAESLDVTSQSRSGSSLLPVRTQIAVLSADIRYIPVAHLLRKPAEAVQNMLLLFCVTNSSGTNLDSFSCPQGECLCNYPIYNTVIS